MKQSDHILQRANLNIAAIIAVLICNLILPYSTLRAETNTLLSVDAANLTIYLNEVSADNLRLEILRHTKEPAKVPKLEAKVFSLVKPTRLVIDVPNSVRAPSKVRTIDHHSVYALRTGGHSNKTRIVLDLKEKIKLSFKKPLSLGYNKIRVKIKLAGGTRINSEKKTEKSVIIKQKEARPEKAVIAKPKKLADAKATEELLDFRLKSARNIKLNSPELSTTRPIPQSKSIRPTTDSPISKLSATTILPALAPSKAKLKKAPLKPEKSKTSSPKKKAATKPKVIKKAEQRLQPKNATQAFTVKGDNIKVVKIDKRRTYSRTPLNPSAAYHENAGGLPSLIEPVEFADAAESVQDDKIIEEAPSSSAVNSSDEKLKNDLQLAEHALKLKALSERLEEMNTLAQNPIPDMAKASDNGIFSILSYLLLAAVALVVTLRYKTIMILLQRRSLRTEPENHTAYLDCYRVLGCKASDSDAQIKSRYRHLVKTFHTDRLNAQDLPEEVLALTNEQFRKIQAAYETVKEMRAF